MSTLLSPNLRQDISQHGNSLFVDALAHALFPMDVTLIKPAVEGAVNSKLFGDIRVSLIEAPAHIASRGAQLINGESEQHTLLFYSLHGTVHICQGAVESSISPGEFALFDWESQFTLSATQGYRAIALHLPTSSLLVPLEAVRKKVITGIRPTAGLEAIVVPLFTWLEGNLSRLRGWSGDRVARSAVEIVCAAFAAQTPEEKGAHCHSAEFIEATHFAEVHLADPQLDAASIASAIFVSVRQLHKIFQAEGTTVSRWIRDRRLEKCRSMLTDPDFQWMSIGDIGATWGLFNRAHFSRVYRAAYGSSPRQHRLGAAR